MWDKVHELYGEDPPKLIVDRLNVELGGILGKYDVVYMSAQKLVQRSLENGYLVGSRASAGCWTGQKSSTSRSSGTTTSPPGCWPVVRFTRTQHRASRLSSRTASSSPTAPSAAGRTCRIRTAPCAGPGM